MAAILFKWLLAAILISSHDREGSHPIYVSVTEIEYNSKEKTLEVSSKIFTDDFENALRLTTKEKVDLLDPSRKNLMLPHVRKYFNSHLKLEVNGKPVQLSFLDFERDDEGITTYLAAPGIPGISTLKVTNNILYEYKEEQMGIIHLIVDGKRKSTKLNNPEEVASFSF